jgi:ATP-dependent Clp protease ATP-binding subunit ClpA
MFEKFTEPARRILFFARYEAAQHGSPTIEPEHLFLGVLREKGPAIGYLQANGFVLDSLRRKTEEALSTGGVASTAVDIPLSGAAKEALEIAMEEGRARPMGAIGAEELLLGIFREGRNASARLLTEGAFNMEGLRLAARAAHGGTWPCRRCGQVMSRAIVEPSVRVRLDVEGYRTPPLVPVAAAICAGCGLVELGVEDPARLHDR